MISLECQSPGGSVYAGLGTYDTMQYIGPDVATICTEVALSMVLCGSAPVRKANTALKRAPVMIHKPSGGMQGTAADMGISVPGRYSKYSKIYMALSPNIADSRMNSWMKHRTATIG